MSARRSKGVKSLVTRRSPSYDGCWWLARQGSAEEHVVKVRLNCFGNGGVFRCGSEQECREVNLPEVESRMSVTTSGNTADSSLPVFVAPDELMAELAWQQRITSLVCWHEPNSKRSKRGWVPRYVATFSSHNKNKNLITNSWRPKYHSELLMVPSSNDRILSYTHFNFHSSAMNTLEWIKRRTLE